MQHSIPRNSCYFCWSKSNKSASLVAGRGYQIMTLECIMEVCNSDCPVCIRHISWINPNNTQVLEESSINPRNTCVMLGILGLAQVIVPNVLTVNHGTIDLQ